MRYFISTNKHERGDVTVYLALTMLSIMLAGALLMSVILIAQLRSTEDAVDSERAFYAANTGMEHGFYELSLFAQPGPIQINDVIEYGGNDPFAAYDVQAGYASDFITPCIAVVGGYPVKAGQSYPDDAPQAQERRLAVGPAGCL